MKRGQRFIDLQGKTYGRLTILGYAGRCVCGGRKVPYWKCRCECGTEVIIANSNIGRTRSCGCLAIEGVKQRATIHGHFTNGIQSKTYSAWCSMLARCSNPKRRDFNDYGGRGITVCERWRNSFGAFLEDMGVKPANHSLDRRDNSGNYEPSNCRWATNQEQGNNRRSNVRITFNQTTQTIKQWCQALGYRPTLVNDRLKRGWSVEKALTEPVRRSHT